MAAGRVASRWRAPVGVGQSRARRLEPLDHAAGGRVAARRARRSSRRFSARSTASRCSSDRSRGRRRARALYFEGASRGVTNVWRVKVESVEPPLDRRAGAPDDRRRTESRSGALGRRPAPRLHHSERADAALVVPLRSAVAGASPARSSAADDARASTPRSPTSRATAAGSLIASFAARGTSSGAVAGGGTRATAHLERRRVADRSALVARRLDDRLSTTRLHLGVGRRRPGDCAAVARRVRRNGC